MKKYNKGKQTQYGLYMGVATRTNETRVSVPDEGCQKTKDGMQKGGDERERVDIWDGVRLEDHGGPGRYRTRRQAAGQTSACDAVPGKAQGHRAMRVHTRMQGMPSRKSRNQAARTWRNVQNTNIELAHEDSRWQGQS